MFQVTNYCSPFFDRLPSMRLRTGRAGELIAKVQLFGLWTLDFGLFLQ